MVQQPLGGACAGCAIGSLASIGDGRCPMVERQRSAGACLYIAGEPAERVLFVKRGAITLAREVDHGRSESLTWTVRRPGTVLGAEALVRPTYLDSARAVTDVVVCVASRDEVSTWMRAHDGAARVLLECVLLTQCADAPRRAGSDGSAQQRVAAWLLEQAREPQSSLPRQVVAALLGMLPETLSRALAALAARGLVEVTRKSVRVLDEGALEAIASGAAR
jgi:CRP-like cAMP-binding protein